MTPMAPAHLVPFDRHSPHLDAISALCERVWGGAGATAQVARHATYPGFKGIVALTPGGEVAGYVYGATALAGQWWTEQIAPLLGAERTARVLIGSFAVTELAVAPEHRRHGLARQLMQVVLADLPQPQATLSTECDNTAARALYEQLGFTYLIERMSFTAAGVPYVVMHRWLPLS